MGKKKGNAKAAVKGVVRKGRGSWVELQLKSLIKVEDFAKRCNKRLTGNEEGAGLLEASTALLDYCDRMRDEIRKLPAEFLPRKAVVQGIVFVPKMPVAVREKYIELYTSCAKKTELKKELFVKEIVGEGRGARIVVRIGADGDRLLGVLPKGHLQTA